MCENLKDYDDYLDREIFTCLQADSELRELLRNLIHLTAYYINDKIKYEYDITITAVRVIGNILADIHQEYEDYILPLNINYYPQQHEFKILWITQDFNISLTIRDSPYYPNISLYVSNGVFKKDATYDDPDDIDIEFL